MEFKKIKCTNCGKETLREMVAIECPDCYILGANKEKKEERKRIIEGLNRIKGEIMSLPNRDDKIGARILMPDGGGVNKFVVTNKIDDLIKRLERKD